MRSVIRVVATSALLSIGAVSGAAAGWWGDNYHATGLGYQYGSYGYGSYGYGTGCGCGGAPRGLFVQQAYETQPPVYVVNQGPTYTGPAITVPVMNYWSHGATRAYPYIEGGYSWHHRYSGGYSDPSAYQQEDWRRPAYAPDYPRYMRPRIHLRHPYYRSRVLRVYGSADMKRARAQMNMPAK